MESIMIHNNHKRQAMKNYIPIMRKAMPIEWYHLGEGPRRIRWSLKAGIDPTFVSFIAGPFLITLVVLAFFGVDNCANAVEFLIYNFIKFYAWGLTIIINIIKIFWWTVIICLFGSWFICKSLF